MNCEKCGNMNEADARFCRHCGEELGLPVKKGKAFVSDSKRSESFLCFGDDDEWTDYHTRMTLGIVFIFVAILMTLAMVGFFENFGNAVGNFFGDFGENMGQIGEDIGAFFSNWGTNFGTAVENFFGGVTWWQIIQPLMVLVFLLVGIILLYRGYREQNR